MLCIKLEVSHVSKDLLLIFKLEQINGLIVIINLKKDYLILNIISNQYLLTEKWRVDHWDLKLVALFPCFFGHPE